MHTIAYSLLVGLALFTSELAVPVGNYQELGRTSTALVQLDTKNILVRAAGEDTLIGAVVKLVLKSPEKRTAYYVNTVVFSCRAELAVTMSSEAFDAKGKLVRELTEPNTVRWVRGSDTAVNVIMSELCKDVTAKPFGGF